MAFLLCRNGQNRLEGRNKGYVHMLSNCDTICSRVCVALFLYHRFLMPKELVTWDRAWVMDTPVPTSSQLQLLLLTQAVEKASL